MLTSGHFCTVGTTVWWFLPESGLWGWLIVNWVHQVTPQVSTDSQAALDSNLKKHFSPGSTNWPPWFPRGNKRTVFSFSARLHPTLYEYLNLLRGNQPYCMLDHFNLQIACVIMICMDCTLFEVGLCAVEKSGFVMICMDLRFFHVERPTVPQWEYLISGTAFTHNVCKHIKTIPPKN